MKTLFSKLREYFNRYTNPVLHSVEDGLYYWREKILLYLMIIFMIFVPVAYVPSIILAIKVELWSIALVDTLGYAYLIYLFVDRKLSVNFRVYSLLLLSYFIGIILLLVVGAHGAGYLWLFIFPVIGSAFFSFKQAMWIVMLNLITMICIGFAYYFELSSPLALSTFSTESWIVITGNFFFLNLISSISVGFIIRGLEKSLKNEQDVAVSLIARGKELQSAKEEAERLNMIKSNFLAQMSHEIRSPISTVMSFISLIREKAEESGDEEVLDYISTINIGSERIIRTIDMILKMSEIQSGTYDIKIEKISIQKDIIDPLIKEFSEIAEKKKINVSIKNLIFKNDSVNADKYSVMQIFVNLIDNAIKYTKQGNVFIILTDTTDTVSIDVIDTGIGISPEYIKDLFEPFTQEESGYTRNFEGSGLGLALVKNYCSLNNADIQVESEKGKGTKFTVTFRL